MKTYEELKQLIDQRGVHEVFGSYGEGFGIEQNAEELAHFLVHMQELGVSSVLEIGTGWKAGLARFLHDDLGWSVTSVDIQDYEHQFGGITFVTGFPADQRWEGSLQADLLIIDGDHSYEGVKADYEWYRTWAQKVIAFHDIAGLRECEGVREYWEDIAYADGVRKVRGDTTDMAEGHIKPGYYEIIAEGDQRGGIGYIVLSEVQDEPEAKAGVRLQYTVDPNPSPFSDPEPKAEIKKPAPKPKTAPRKRAPAKKPAATAKKTTATKK